MKTVILAAVTGLSLGVGSAYAFCAPGRDQPPVYGSQAYSDHTTEAQPQFLGPKTVFEKIFRKTSGHPNSNEVATAPRN